MSMNPEDNSAALQEAQNLMLSLAGEWEGTTRTWFEPGKLAGESPYHATIRPLRGGHFILHEYETSLDGKPVHGMAIYGYDQITGQYEGAWVDSFHMSTNMMISRGERVAGGFFLLGSYADPGGGPSWGWRTRVELTGPDDLVLTAYNITPQGEEMKAIETVCTRREKS